ncbi:prolipoprotein diacylglyceryl transferase, partial [bacterium]|nr:prolipoprotein diacylglyceryl transferase [bacterium]
MIIHNFDPVLVDLGFIQIKWYSLAYILGIILGWVFAIKIIKKTQNNKYNFTQVVKEDFDDLVIYLVFGIILGGRLGYVFFYNLEYYSHNYLEILKLWQGGMSFHGGLLGVIISIYIFSIKKNINFFKISDIVSCVAPIGIFLVRIANFINGELYGKVTSVAWGVVFKNGGNVTRHPSQIYEAILEGAILFIIINYLAFGKKLIFKTGYISVFFLISYSVLRIFAEFFREPDNHLGY